MMSKLFFLIPVVLMAGCAPIQLQDGHKFMTVPENCGYFYDDADINTQRTTDGKIAYPLYVFCE